MSTNDHASLHGWMNSAGLGHLTSHFLSLGVTEENFPALTLLDFDRLGVSDMIQRQRLFKLLQVVRDEAEREKQREKEQAELLANSIPAVRHHSSRELDQPLNFGLKSFFDHRQSTATSRSSSVTNSVTSSPIQRAPSTQVVRGEREYLTLPLKREILLSPPRSFGEDSPRRPITTQPQVANLTLTPSKSASKLPGKEPFQHRPMSPHKSFLSNLLSNNSSANGIRPPVNAWTATATPTSSTTTTHLAPTTTIQPPPTSPRSSEYLAAQAAFHARSFPNSPVHPPSTSSSNAPSTTSFFPSSSPSFPSSPVRSSHQPSPARSPQISPKSTFALQSAHDALERIRAEARQLAESDSRVEEKEAYQQPSSQPYHHRTLFPTEQDAPQSTRTSSILPDRSSSTSSSSASMLRPSTSPPISPPRNFARVSSLHPLEPADFLADDADLDEIIAQEDDDEEDLQIEGASGDLNESLSFLPQSRPSTGGVHSSAKIRVAVRTRPLNQRERARGETDVVQVQSHLSSLTVLEPKTRVDLTKFEASHSFHFDATFGETSTNEFIYQHMCQPLVEFMMQGHGGRASCFAYGQTGAGKTYTLIGPQGGKSEHSGLYVLAAQDIFKILKQKQQAEYAQAQAQKEDRPSGPSLETKFMHCSIYVSFFEIYSGKLFDLLHTRSKLVCRADAAGVVHVVGLRERKCRDVAELMALIREGNKVRSTGQTGANIDSSRSHAILSISLKQIVPLANVVVQHARNNGHPSKFRLKTQGKFSFIDLAGSERAADTSDNDRRTRLEGAEINKSLLALKECIRALDQGQIHTPFRGSILTQVLKDSFVGNSRTVMIANIGPNSLSCEHTLNTLRYADRVKQLKKGVVTPLPSSLPIPTPILAPAGGCNKSARGSAGAEAYMPHQAIGRNVKISRLPLERSSLAVNESHSISASPIRPSPQPLSGRSSLHPSASMQQLQSSPSRPAATSARSQATVMSQLRPSSTDHTSPPASSSTDPSADHHDLCARILLEEEALVSSHRASIDARMSAMKLEMELLRNFDSVGCTVDEYVKQLDELLKKNGTGSATTRPKVSELRGKIRVFDLHLKEEEQLSASFKRQRSIGST